jgi:hypothetical protein
MERGFLGRDEKITRAYYDYYYYGGTTTATAIKQRKVREKTPPKK